MFIRSVLSTMPPWMGTQPPTSPVPAPRTVTGIFSRLHSFMMAETSSVLSTRHIASGMTLP